MSSRMCKSGASRTGFAVALVATLRILLGLVRKSPKRGQCILDRVRVAIPKRTEGQFFRDQINTAPTFPPPDFVSVELVLRAAEPRRSLAVKLSDASPPGPVARFCSASNLAMSAAMDGL